MKHYDIVVMGEEISGVWLLKKLSQMNEDSGSDKRRKKLPQNLLWIRSTSSLPKFNLPLSIAENFGVSFAKKRNIEFASPSKVFLWNEKKIESYLSDHSINTFSLLNFDQKTKRICQHLLKTHPELSSISEGIWFYLGFSETVASETKLWASLISGQIVDWNLANEPAMRGVEVKSLSPTSKLKLNKISRKIVEIELANNETISTESLFLNMQLSKFRDLFSEEDFKMVGFQDSLFSNLARYHFQIEFEKGTYLPFQKSCLLFSTSHVPEVHKEISYLEQGSKISIQVCERRSASLDSILDRFKSAVKDLSRGFPEYSLKVKSFYPSLGMDTCYTGEFREKVVQSLNEGKRDLYRMTLSSSQTALVAVKNLSPIVNSHLPYPMGPLLETQKCLSNFM